MQIPPLVFNRYFSRFDKQIRSESGVGFVSFREGLPATWEAYKEDLRKEALYRLDVPSWKRDEIGTGRILDSVILAIEVNEPRRKIRNNLVDWPNRYGPKRQSHRALIEAKSDSAKKYPLERWFFDFFKTSRSEERLFEEFRKLGGNRYDIIAYLFFLKDWKRFMPIATATFDQALALFGFDLVTSGHCSWLNYVHYNDCLLCIQQALRDFQGVSDARLIDAHSFCWMLMRQNPQEAPPETVIPLPTLVEELETIDIKESEINKEEFDIVDEEQFLKHQAQNRQLGKLAQDIALRSERKRLVKLGVSDSKAVKPVWDELKRGYDILSREVDGKARLIEVKAARKSGKLLSFFLSAYEWRVSQGRPNYYFYLVLNARSSRPVVLMIKASRLRPEHLRPANFISTFAATF